LGCFGHWEFLSNVGKNAETRVTYTILACFGHANFEKSPIFMAVLRLGTAKNTVHLDFLWVRVVSDASHARPMLIRHFRGRSSVG
jgi:hypothetical protein